MNERVLPCFISTDSGCRDRPLGDGTPINAGHGGIEDCGKQDPNSVKNDLKKKFGKRMASDLKITGQVHSAAAW